MIGADGEKSNKDVMALILELMGKNRDDYQTVSDRPGHDLRYAIDWGKIRTELGWQPKYTDFRGGLSQTIDWYKKNQAWWEPQKATTESRYTEVEKK